MTKIKNEFIFFMSLMNKLYESSSTTQNDASIFTAVDPNAYFTWYDGYLINYKHNDCIISYAMLAGMISITHDNQYWLFIDNNKETFSEIDVSNEFQDIIKQYPDFCTRVLYGEIS